MTLLTRCAGNIVAPSQPADTEHLTSKTVQTRHYQHRVYSNLISDGRRLHVYLDGDGTPWLDGARISPDPTPRNPMALRLMSHDHNPAIYVGRPCHFLARQDPLCQPDSWTFGRYSEQVVASLSEAIEHAAASHGDLERVLIGYSGGGTLAVLVAERLPGVSAVVTIAANLDIDHWTQLRQFEPLTGSLNPNLRPPLPSHIHQFHLVGGRDEIVPPAVTYAYTRRDPHTHTHTHTLDQNDHVCCWLRQWPALLARMVSHWNREPV